MRVTLKSISDRLAELGHKASLEKGDGYFYFSGGEATDWLDRTVKVPTRLTIRVEQPETEHTVSVRKLQSWLDGGGKSPNEKVAKSRLKEILPKQLIRIASRGPRSKKPTGRSTHQRPIHWVLYNPFRPAKTRWLWNSQ